MLDIDGTTNRVTTECGHEFHTKCLLSNIAYNGFGCPYCRSEMVEESVANRLHEDDDEDDDDDDEEDDGDDDEDDEDDGSELEESDILRGFRFMLERTTGEVLTNDDDVIEENEYQDERDRDETPKPSVALITKKLSENGVTIETFVKALLLDHSEYNEVSEEEFYKINDDLFDKIRDIISNYKVEQEEELEEEQELSSSIELLTKDLLVVPSNHVEAQDDNYNFYFLENDFVEKCKQNANTFLLDEEPNYNNYLIEEQFISSIMSAVF
jgi:hypothetical protein